MSPLISERGLEMLGYLPRYYEGATLTRELLQVSGHELDSLRASVNALLNNLFVRTADDWGLDRWEDELGLAPDPSLTIAERQDRIVGKLRGFGTATREAVERVANAYAYGTVVVEDQDNDPTLVYIVRVRFTGETGIPSNISDVQAAVRAIVPAHLDIVYVFTFNTWDETDAKNWTWDQMDGTALGGPAGAPLTWDQWDSLEI